LGDLVGNKSVGRFELYTIKKQQTKAYLIPIAAYEKGAALL
jgi:hypothetical protein